jgi:cell division protein FtsB
MASTREQSPQMKESKFASIAIIVLAMVLSLLLSGCNGSASESQLAQAKKSGAAAQAHKDQLKRQQREQAKLKAQLKRMQAQSKKHPAPQAPPATVTVAPPNPSRGGTSCGVNLSVGGDTSCPFAQYVASAYYQSSGGYVTLYDVYSPVTAKYYVMTCVPGTAAEVCTGGINAVVYIQ